MRPISWAVLLAAAVVLITGCAGLSRVVPFSAAQAEHESAMMEEKHSILQLMADTTLKLAEEPCAEIETVIEAEFSKIREASLGADAASPNRLVEVAKGQFALETSKGFGGTIRYRKGMAAECTVSAEEGE